MTKTHCEEIMNRLLNTKQLQFFNGCYLHNGMAVVVFNHTDNIFYEVVVTALTPIQQKGEKNEK